MIAEKESKTKRIKSKYCMKCKQNIDKHLFSHPHASAKLLKINSKQKRKRMRNFMSIFLFSFLFLSLSSEAQNVNNLFIMMICLRLQLFFLHSLTAAAASCCFVACGMRYLLTPAEGSLQRMNRIHSLAFACLFAKEYIVRGMFNVLQHISLHTHAHTH